MPRDRISTLPTGHRKAIEFGQQHISLEQLRDWAISVGNRKAVDPYAPDAVVAALVLNMMVALGQRYLALASDMNANPNRWQETFGSFIRDTTAELERIIGAISDT